MRYDRVTSWPSFGQAFCENISQMTAYFRDDITVNKKKEFSQAYLGKQEFYWGYLQ